MIATLALLAGMDINTHKNVEFDVSKAKKASVIAFVSAKCPCSASHEQKLKDLHSEYKAKGFDFVAVHSNTDEDLAMTDAHFQASRFAFPVIQDQSARIANAFGAVKTPHVFVVSPKHEVMYQGGVDDSHAAQSSKTQYLRDALAAVDAGKMPEVREARSLGCAIKR